MSLETLSQLGLPGWFIIAAASVFILKQIGLLDFVTSRFIDIQEHRQKQDELKLAYSQTEATEAHRMMGDLLATAQENERRASDFIRQDIKNDMESVIIRLNNLLDATKHLAKKDEERAKLFTLQNGILSEMSHDLRSQQSKLSILIELIQRED